MRRLTGWLAAIILVGAALYFLILWPLRSPHPPLRLATGALAVRGRKIYVSPDQPPLENGTVLMRDGRIVAVGSGVEVPSDAQVISCGGCVVTAGFWNAHVHFTQPKWMGSAWKPGAVLNQQLADMLTSRGFTTVVDTGSDPRGTISLRRRIETGDLSGPKIYTAGAAVYPPHGIPYYLGDLPFFVRWLTPQPESPEAAARDVSWIIAAGADLLKLFTGSYVRRGEVLPMPESIAMAAAAEAHRHGQLVFIHPSNLAGTLVAIHSGVDVLAHAPDSTEGIDQTLLQQIVDRHMAMVPTLKMFGSTVTKNPKYLQPIYAEVRQFHALGGQLIFGTDAGYMTDYSTEDEFRALQESGLGFEDVLRMLTTNPADRFGVSKEKGTLAPGKLADVTILGADPAADITAFSRVRYTIRSGRVIFNRN